MDQHALSLARPHGVVEDVPGDLIVGERSRGVEIDAVGQRKGSLGGRRDVLRNGRRAGRSRAVA
jgi:hypothetical protein